MIGNGLAYVSVVVRDVAAVAEMLNRDFRLEASMLTVGSGGNRTPVFPIGDTAIALFEVGRPLRRRRGAHRRPPFGRVGGFPGKLGVDRRRGRGCPCTPTP